MENKMKERNFSKFERSTIFVMAEQDWGIVDINNWLAEYQGINKLAPRMIKQKYLENVRYANSLALGRGRMDLIIEFRSGENTNYNRLVRNLINVPQFV
jgi:hypothetical protein